MRRTTMKKVVVSIAAGVMAMVIICLCAAGCASRPTAAHPVPKMLDPVTEEVPDVIHP